MTSVPLEAWRSEATSTLQFLLVLFYTCLGWAPQSSLSAQGKTVPRSPALCVSVGLWIPTGNPGSPDRTWCVSLGCQIFRGGRTLSRPWEAMCGGRRARSRYSEAYGVWKIFGISCSSCFSGGCQDTALHAGKASGISQHPHKAPQKSESSR